MISHLGPEASALLQMAGQATTDLALNIDAAEAQTSPRDLQGRKDLIGVRSKSGSFPSTSAVAREAADHPQVIGNLRRRGLRDAPVTHQQTAAPLRQAQLEIGQQVLALSDALFLRVPIVD